MLAPAHPARTLSMPFTSHLPDLYELGCNRMHNHSFARRPRKRPATSMPPDIQSDHDWGDRLPHRDGAHLPRT